tara:strand:- start:229 stop:1605 length:1377 start_codon:yes stop_codon:yes gene_type:complete
MKKLMLICAPVTSRSGYGAHARDLVNSFFEHDKYDIKILDVRWGDCPRNALNEDNENDKRIINAILPKPELERQPDVYVDIRIPNEFQTIGKVNIGITAGVETTAVSQAWIDGCNRMDLVIVPSEHSKKGFLDSRYDKLQQMPNGQQQKVGEVKLEKPMEVLFEGADEEIYKPLKHDEIDSEFFNHINDMVKEDFAFLFVGQWTKGNYGEDRKDIYKMIKVFYESFANKKEQPALILKTNGATYSIMDREECLTKINQIKTMFPSDWKLPNVYLLHGSFSDEEMNILYNHPKIKTMISLTHGEGFGRPLLEATMTGLPVVASGWSGQLDFLSDQDSLLLGGQLVDIPKSIVWKDILIPESQWFNVNENQAYKCMNYCLENETEISKKGKNLMKINRGKFTLSKMVEKLDKIMEKYTSSIPQEVGIQLPKLSKAKNKSSKPTDIKLPKLKQMTTKEVSV